MPNLVTVDAVSTTAPVLSPADEAAHVAASYVRPARRLIAAGVKRGSGPLVVEQPTTAPLPPIAVEALHRMELALAEQTVANFDTHGSLWGYDTVETADAQTAESLAEDATVEEWETADRDGQPLRVMRVVHPKWGTDIRVTSTWPAAARRGR